MNVSKKFLYILLFGFIIVLGSSYADNVSATSSPVKSYTTNSNNFTTQPLCENNDCVGYNYIHIWIENWTAPASGYTFFNVTNSGNEWFRINFFDTTYVDKQYYFPIVPTGSNLGIKFQYGTTVNWEYVDSLGGTAPVGTINITSNGSYDVSSYGTAVVEVPNEENSQFMGVVIDSFWQYHVAFASASVGIIVIFLVYRIIKGRLR